MGILAILCFGILGILLIAKLASKLRPEEERSAEKKAEREIIKTTPSEEPTYEYQALTALLIRKEIISKEELLQEISQIKKHKEMI
ncbi:MAG: hypothetical protein ACE5GK_04305 [Nitrospiria bacterium]